jgi:hypothetical protein
MSNPFISMIEAFSFNFAPRGWALCAGQTLSIAQNTALFSLLGTTFGGNGQTTFNLPDLRGSGPRSYPQRQQQRTNKRDQHPEQRGADGQRLRHRGQQSRRKHLQQRCADGRDGCGRGQYCRRRGTARKPDAVFDHQLLHCAPRNFPVAELRSRRFN